MRHRPPPPSTRPAPPTRPAPTPAAATPAAALPDGASLQDLAIAASVATVLGTAVVANARGDAAPCSLCQGTGGCACFACAGAGRRDPVGEDAADAASRPPTRRDVLGRAPPPRGACRVCGGSGLILCRDCSGSGFK